MLTPRSNFGIEVINHRLFVVGGFNGNSTTFNVESYSASQNEWSAARDMEIFRSAVSCCVVFGLPNLSEYTAPRDALALLHIQEEEEPVDPPNTIWDYQDSNMKDWNKFLEHQIVGEHFSRDF